MSVTVMVTLRESSSYLESEPVLSYELSPFSWQKKLYCFCLESGLFSTSLCLKKVGIEANVGLAPERKKEVASKQTEP